MVERSGKPVSSNRPSESVWTRPPSMLVVWPAVEVDAQTRRGTAVRPDNDSTNRLAPLEFDLQLRGAYRSFPASRQGVEGYNPLLSRQHDSPRIPV